VRVFDPQTFHKFLGEPIHCKTYEWGIEQRYRVSVNSLREFETFLANTLYFHHSSFDLSDAITEIGFPLVAQAMRQRNSGIPIDENTQMAHLGEVIGAEFARALLGFETTRAFAKRLNPNVDQPMKGADILGLRGSHRPAELLIGEAKAGRRLHKPSIEEGYDHLVALHRKEASRMLKFMKEVFRLEGDRESVTNVDRHTADDVPRHYLLLAVTQSAPKEPFDIIAERFKRAPIPRLLAAHIQIQDLKVWLPKIFSC
jgi:hypothetical protein